MSSGFRVEPQAVRDFAQRVGTCEQDAADGIGYLNRNGDLSWTQTGFLSFLRGAHETVMTELASRFTHLQEVLEQSAAELERTATYYEVTDEDEARKFDQELPPPGRIRPGEEP